MAEANNNDNNSTSVAQQQRQQQQLLLQQQQRQRQQQLFLMQQQQLQLHQQQQQQQQQQQLQRQQQQQQQQQQSIHQPTPYNLLQQQAISRFPSNIDAHLRAPGLRSAQFQPHPPPPSSSQPPPVASNFQQHHTPQQSQPARPPVVAVGSGRPGNPVEVEMAQKDAFMVCNPDYKRPFASVEDAVLRLLPYHVVSDYEAEEDDRILDSDTTGNVVSRLQQWDHNILSKIAEFTTTFERQVLAFNIMSRKRGLGEFRSEERLMIEQALLHEEKQALLKVRAEIESRERAGREASEAKMRMAMLQTEHAQVEASGHAGMFAHTPFRANAAASLTDEGSGNVGGQEQGGNINEIQGWGNTQREDEEPSEDFLNDENEPDNADTAEQAEWQDVGELDLNSRR